MGMILNDTFDIFKHNVCFFDNDDPVNFLFMSDNVFSRIENELEAQQKRHEWFCLAIGGRQESYSQNWTNWRKRGFPARKIPEAAKVLDVSIEWLSTGKGPKQPNVVDISAILPGLKGDLSVEPGPEFQAVHYGSFRLQAGVVGFAVDMQDENNAPLFFRADWLASQGLKAKHLTARKISGDSMSPGLQDGDTVLIDTSRIEPKDGKVFAVNYEGELVIKRMIRDAGQWWLASDNPDKTRYPHKLCAGDLCLIIGQCVHKQSTMI